MKHFIHFTLLFLSLGMSLSSAASDAQTGKSKAGTCFACHGENGIGIADIYPNLAGQKQAYLISSIKAYKDGSRSGGMSMVMAPMVSTLSEEDMADIAAYYSSLE